MKNEEIISFLRGEKANDPSEYERHMNFYKEKYPDLYNTVLKPALEPNDGVPVKPAVIKPQQFNPAEMFSAKDVKPLGSADVGELVYEVQGPKKKEGEPAVPAAPKTPLVGTVQRKNPNIKIIGLISGLVVLIMIIVLVVVYLI